MGNSTEKSDMYFNLEQFEYAAYTRLYESSMQHLLRLLRAIDSQYGLLGGSHFEARIQSEELANGINDHILCRLTSAVTSLVTDPQFHLSEAAFETTLNLHRWLSALFAASSFGNADHILRSFNVETTDRDLHVPKQELLKFCLFYFAESEIPLNVETLWAYNKRLAAGLFFALLSPRFLASPAAHQKREILLQWLPSRLTEVTNLDDLPMGILHDAYMHCSYADCVQKHEIKKPINALIRRKLDAHGLNDLRFTATLPFADQKPVLLVVLEWFSANHSIYRTHSLTIDGLRKHFNVIGMGYASHVDEVGRNIFDEFIELHHTEAILKSIARIRDVSLAREVQILYMPSVGMFPLTLFLSNIRIAPIQTIGLGHPATTHSSVIDYVVVEEDYVGDENCFSEKLIKLPKDGMPYRPSAILEVLSFKGTRLPNPEIIKIVIAATTMKLNPGFLSTCAKIAQMASRPVQFHFLIGQAQGLIYPQVQRLIRRYLGDNAIVYPHQDYPDYMRVIANCEFFLNPFPFGNTNGIIDTVYAGLIGVCKTGAEVHQHIDEGLFHRLNFPDWLIAHDEKEYITAALRLITDSAERNQLSQELSGPTAINTIFTGRTEVLGEKLETLWRAQLQAIALPKSKKSKRSVLAKEKV